MNSTGQMKFGNQNLLQMISYKILHWLFGWDYVLLCGSCDRVIARVFILPDGRVVAWEHKRLNWLYEIGNPDQVVWLTCLSSKYLPDET